MTNFKANTSGESEVLQAYLVHTTRLLKGHLLPQFGELNQLSKGQPRTRPSARKADGANGQAGRQGQQDHFFGSGYPLEWSYSNNAAYPLQTQAQQTDFFFFCKPAQFTHLCHAEPDQKKMNNADDSVPKCINPKLLGTDPWHTDKCISDS